MDLLIANHTVPLDKADRALKKVIDPTPQYATDGNPAEGIPATHFPAAHYNSVIAEITNAIEAGGKKLDKDDWGQLASVIKDFFKQLETKINQEDLDKKLKDIDVKVDLSPYYKKSGDELSGAMHTNGNQLWGKGNNTYIIGQDDSWYIKNKDNVTLISFENGNIILNGQYSSFKGNELQINTINSNTSGQVTFDTETAFTKSINLISSLPRPQSGNRQTNTLLLRFSDDEGLFSRLYNQENVGNSNNFILHVKGGNNEYYYVFDNFGKFSCENILVKNTVNTNNIQTNYLTIQDNNLLIQSDNTMPDGNGFIHGNGIYFKLLKRGVNGSIYLQEHPGVETALIFQASGGGRTSSMSFNELGILAVNRVFADKIQVNNIGNNNGDKVTFDTAVTFTQPVIVENSFRINNNDFLINSDVSSVSTGSYRNTNSFKFQFQNDPASHLLLYFQEHAGIANNAILNVKGGDNEYNYTFDNFGTITGKYFNGVAAEADYADLAEYYRSDQQYDPGTIVKIGGVAEITTTSKGGYFFGVISSRPGFLMNTKIKGEDLALPVALSGRVPVKIIGPIQKGDPITLSENEGIAIKANHSENIIGFSLEDNFDEAIRLVECSVKSIGGC